MVGSEAQARSKLRPGGFNLDGLIQHRVIYSQRRDLQRETLIATACFDPVCLVAAFGDEHCDTGRMKNRSPVCSASVEPKRIQCLGSSTNARLSICAVLPATTDSSTLSMARARGRQSYAHPVASSGLLEQTQLRRQTRHAVVVAAGTPTLGDRLKQRRDQLLSWRQEHRDDPIAVGLEAGARGLRWRMPHCHSTLPPTSALREPRSAQTYLPKAPQELVAQQFRR